LNNKERKMAKCSKKTEIYSRVVGYFRPTADWNKGKKEEFKDRKTYSTKCADKQVA
jgi:ribonucleoside-triphosphate reductase